MTPQSTQNIAGIILAGGLSRRMGGLEKSLIKLKDKPLIQWVMEALNEQVENLAINANGDNARFSFLNKVVIEDSVQGFVGPLAGTLTAMQWAKHMPHITHIITAAADTPFIPHDLPERLQAAVTGDNDIVMACSNGRIHPVFCLWPVHLAKALEHFLVVEDKRKILEFAHRYTLREVVFDQQGEDVFFNINTPEDLAIAKARVGETGNATEKTSS